MSQILFFFLALQRGFCYTCWWHNGYLTPESDSSLSLLRNLGTEWVSLVVTWYQDSPHIPNLAPSLDSTPSDSAVIYVINRIHSLNMKVSLKLHLDCRNGEWRGYIQPDSEGVWFRNYLAFLKHYLQLANSFGVEEFVIGTELEGTTRNYEREWRMMIDTVRRYYSGRILYSANWNRYQTDLSFWDALDFVGISAFFPLTDRPDPSLEDLSNAWEYRWLPEISSFQRRVGKPIIFSEIGYRSVDGCNIRPWDWQMRGEVDTTEQKGCYEAALFTFFYLPWFEGIYFWNWLTDPAQGGPNCTDYTPNNKPAARIVADWYRRIGIKEEGLVSSPNPFRERVQIFTRYSLPKELKIYDIKGRFITKKVVTCSPQELVFRNLPSGLYFGRVDKSSFKLIKVK